MLSLTKEEVTLLLQVSTMDVFTDYTGGPDLSHQTCPLCNASISEDDKVSNYVSEEFFNREILPTIPDELSDGWHDYEYKYILIYQLEYRSLIPFPHKEGCKIEELKALHKKMQDFLGDKE
jgi:hypothetical protein